MSATNVQEQSMVIASIMNHLGIYTYQHPARLEKCEMNDWHLSAAIHAMCSLQCTYSSISFALNISFSTVSYHMSYARELQGHCVFFGVAVTLYQQAGREALTSHQNAVRVA
jgi:hypothetical protein